MNEASSPDEKIKSVYTTNIKGRQYVVIDGPRKRLAVYRVRPYDGVLRMLRRWPKELQHFNPKESKKSTETYFSPIVEDPFDAIEQQSSNGKEENLPPWRSSTMNGSRYVHPERQRM